MATDFENGLKYLYGLQSHGIKPGLSRTTRLLSALGDPHRSFQAFHIAGTNGKGSTAAMLASILGRQGYRVGLYTSPHLIDFTERIQINGESIVREQVWNWAHTIQKAAESDLDEPPTFFEATTVMAFAHFAQMGVQYGVIEVGLGGRFDATNVVTPLVSVITTIGMDHQDYLGHSLEEIAAEKAGIVKHRQPVIVGRIEERPLVVIEATAVRQEAPCVVLGRDFDVVGQTPARFSYRSPSATYDDVSCPLTGRHQLDNAGCALAAVDAARVRGVVVEPAAIREGLAMVRWPGRLEVVGQRPEILLDGAHNPQAAEALAVYLTTQAVRAPKGRVIFVIGMMRDKDRRGVLTQLSQVPRATRFIFTQAAHPRAADSTVLAGDAAALGLSSETIPTVAGALKYARAHAGPDDTICVTGSLLVVGEAKAALEGTAVSDLRG